MEIILCQNCKYYFGELKCMAFPDRIPDEILKGDNDHSKPLPDQGDDIVFENKGKIIITFEA
jgi:hypothetical protein